jgi:sarcosine oxidase subunit gamma
VAELAALAPTHGLALPFEAGATRLSARAVGGLLSVAPFGARAEAVGAVLGASLPPPGRAAGAVAWMGLGLWFVETDDAGLAERLAPEAAVTDQSDGWACLLLEGEDARAVLARLVPLDLEEEAFRDGAVARTQLRQLACALIRRGGAFEIRVMRSFAATAHHDLTTAMRAVAARRLP